MIGGRLIGFLPLHCFCSVLFTLWFEARLAETNYTKCEWTHLFCKMLPPVHWKAKGEEVLSPSIGKGMDISFRNRPHVKPRNSSGTPYSLGNCSNLFRSPDTPVENNLTLFHSDNWQSWAQSLFEHSMSKF